jgi:hypothetical protein
MKDPMGRIQIAAAKESDDGGYPARSKAAKISRNGTLKRIYDPARMEQKGITARSASG